MANLSNINNYFIVDASGQVAIGDVSSATLPTLQTQLTVYDDTGTAGVIIQSGGTSGKKYELFSNASGTFGIADIGVANRLTISSGGDATFGGNVTATNILTVAGAATGSPFLQFTQGGTQKAYIQYADSGDSFELQTDNQFVVRTGGTTTALTINSSQNTTFAGDVTLSDGSLNITQSVGTDTFTVTTPFDRVGKFISTDAGAFLAIQDNSSTNNGVGINVTGNILKLLTDNTVGFTLNASQNATFAGTVAAEDEIYLTDAGTVRAKLLLNASDRDNVELRAESLGSTMKFFTVGTEALELDASQNANFVGNVIVGATALNTAGSFSIKNNGIIRGVLASGTADDTIINAISGVSNGFQLTNDASNNQEYIFHNGSTESLKINSSGNATFAGTVAVNGDFLTVGDGDNANTLIQTRSSAGNISGIKIARGAGDWSSTQNNNFGLLVSDNGIELAKLTALGQNSTGRAPYLTIADGGTATFAGDVKIAEASNKGQLFFGTADSNYEIKGGGNYGYLGLNGPILRFDTGGSEKLRIDSNGVLQLTETSASGFVNANGTSLELDINRNPETGAFGDANKSHARINLTGANGGSFIIFNTASANNTTATERMRVDSAGSVLINRTSNATNQALQVHGFIDITNVGSTALRWFDGSNFRGGLGTNQWATGGNATDMTLYAVNNQFFVAGGGNNIRMTIDSSGRVMINATSQFLPAIAGGTAQETMLTITKTQAARTNLVINNQTNDVNAGAALVLAHHGADYILEGQSTLRGGAFTIHRSSAERFRISATGNVGIGRTTDTAKKLDVLGVGLRLQDTSNYSSITIGASGWNQDYPYQRLDTFNSDGSGYFWAFGHKKTDGTKTVRMLIADTSTPYVTVINQLNIATFATNQLGGSGNYPTFTTNVVIRNSGNSYFNGGNVGIGDTSPNEKLTISGNINIKGTGGYLRWNSGDIAIVNAGSFAMAFQTYTGTALTEKMRITSAGNVGIGNTSPSQKLHVTGSVLASSDVVAFSDKKLKENIKTLDGSKVYYMRGVSFTRKDTGKDSSGVIAQEIQKIAPELVTDNDGTLSVAYGNLTGYLIEAVKELKAEIEELKKHKCDCKE